MNSAEQYMQRCFDLAKLGAGTVSPNPMVGAVIVHHDTIVGEGFTSPYGGPHAEVNAVEDFFKKYGDQAAVLFPECIVYVSLEPCAHFGKTPPCADMLASYHPKKVVIGCLDPFGKVNGRGIEILRQAGIEVEVGMLEQEALWLNRRFFTRIKENRPYVILKWAESKDGFIGKEKEQIWLSNRASKQLVHKWRSEEDAILVGIKTVLVDNPSLTTRDWLGKNPVRIVIDKNLEISKDAAVFDTSAETIVFNALKMEWNANVKYIELENFDFYLPQNILYQLYLMDIQSILIEGGSKTLQMFIDAGLWDEARIFKTPVLLSSGVKSPTIKGVKKDSCCVATDELLVLLPDTHNC